MTSGLFRFLVCSALNRARWCADTSALVSLWFWCPWAVHRQGLRLSLLFTSRCALFLVGRPMKLGIMAGVARMDSYALGSDMIKAGTAVTMHLALCSLDEG